MLEKAELGEGIILDIIRALVLSLHPWFSDVRGDMKRLLKGWLGAFELADAEES